MVLGHRNSLSSSPTQRRIDDHREECSESPPEKLQRTSPQSLQNSHANNHSPNQFYQRLSSIDDHPERKKRFRSAEIIVYVIFFVLLIIYVALQIIIATIHLDSDNAVKNGIRTTVSKRIFNLFPSLITHISPQRSQDGYTFIFRILLAINIAALVPTLCKNKLLKWTKSQQQHHRSGNQEVKQSRIIHKKLLYRTYLPAYLLATCADWLQGPYKYALYSAFGYKQNDIAYLFVAGYGSGLLIGTIVGGLADQYGRKKLCLCYCLCYVFSVFMKHFKTFYMLLLGRVGGGIATSLLFSVFESWLIGAHIEKGLLAGNSIDDKNNKEEEEEKLLAESFSISTYGSSLVAIVSGVLANIVVEHSGQMRPLSILGGRIVIYVGGYVAAFDATLVPLILCSTLIACLWDENYAGGNSAPNTHRDDIVVEDDMELITTQRNDSSGDFNDDVNVVFHESTGKPPETSQPSCSAKIGILSGVKTVWNSPHMLSICIIASAFEGSMYIFVFLWTPALTHVQTQLNLSDDELPLGWIFASFMCCCMLGSISFSRLSSAGVSASICLVGTLALSAASCLLMSYPNISGNTGANTVQYWGMLSYEFAIGAYYPAMSVLKGTVVPEDQRATIYNVFRLPLNLLVLINLMAGFSTQSSFLINAILLSVACILEIRLVGKMATVPIQDRTKIIDA